MTSLDAHLTHDELATPAQMAGDCRAAGTNLRLERAARAAVTTAPSIHFADYREAAKRDIRVSDAAARLASALELHL